jgi:hypothetical protein
VAIPAAGTIRFGGHTIAVCNYHRAYFQKYIAPLEIENYACEGISTSQLGQ